MTSRPATAARRPSARAIVGAAALDAALVTTFAAIGRASHGESAFAGLGATAWPFLVGLAAGWVATLAWRAPARPVRTGIGVWLVTVGIGMLLRAASGQGIAAAFIVVATITLAVFLVGWRLIAALIGRRRATAGARRGAPDAHGLSRAP
ncbi:DUF3054 domain-containing protein [Microbacterium hominis]|uniref:DUF3054 domain-containing protein n=1 Tax=Microbacterium hominis TaxID=162426 RepID=A0A7D4U3K1_9MICO|nr:DUF3054 domain-containing protein [Microbacterium hominis]QKJ18705.1 DUF3054 domain-containing protein [Microbacterium hominis]